MQVSQLLFTNYENVDVNIFVVHVTVIFSACHGNPVAMQDVLLSTSAVESSDCLIEGSTKDAVTHFTLRYHCAPLTRE